MKKILYCCFCFVLTASSFAKDRDVIDLNGIWDFDQTLTAFPPKKFTRKIPVPGLVHLAEPRIDQVDLFFTKPRKVGTPPNILDAEYSPRYNWYSRRVHIPKELAGKQAVLTVLKSQYVTRAFVNGVDVGSSMSCYTPLDFMITRAVHFGGENEILICVDDHDRLPPEAAGGIDAEKINYLPGIWDDVSVSFTNGFRIHRTLVLPSLQRGKVKVKLLVRSFYPVRNGYGVPIFDTCKVHISIREKVTGNQVAFSEGMVAVKGSNLASFEIELPIQSAHAWTPDDPFLYVADVILSDSNKTSDRCESRFGMRDFERRGRHFYLNGEKIMLRGSNIGFHRFLNDRDCGALPWNRDWVRKMLADIPKGLNWNMMRFHVGIVPRFWYDIADEAGLMIQNEWFYWQYHGWDDRIRDEYTDWVWSDGSHPSIVIWDAMNEYNDDFIANRLIPELRKLDPTRIWDNGYMTVESARQDEMDEPHVYNSYLWLEDFERYTDEHPYPIGDLQYWTEYPQSATDRSAAQILNEYGWIWLARDGSPSFLGYKFYNYYLGRCDDFRANRELQAYVLQCETEVFRAHREIAGVLAFCYLANNYGSTGDWFIGDIRNLTPGPTFQWFRHCFAPAAVFIDLVDQRYTKHTLPNQPGSSLDFNLIGVNDFPDEVAGKVDLRLIDSAGKDVARQTVTVKIPGTVTHNFPVHIQLPWEKGGYLLVAEFLPDDRHDDRPIISRRYVKVGDCGNCLFYNFQPDGL